MDSKRTRKVPTRALRALEKIVLIAKEREIAVLIQRMRSTIIGPGWMDTISRRKKRAARRKIAIEQVALKRKST